MHKKQKWESIICFITAIILSLFAIAFANQKLMEFIETEFYEVNGRDILTIIFLTDDFHLYPYLNRNDITIALPTFSFYIIGIILSNSSFLSKSGEYYTLIYSRVGSKKRALSYMKKNSFRKTSIYVITYSISCYIGMWLSLANYSTQSKTNYCQLYIELFLHTIATLLLFFVLQKIIFFIYINRNPSISFFIGIITIFLFFILDIQTKTITIMFLSPTYFYFDSIGILSTLSLILQLLENKFSYLQLPYDGGNEN